MIIVSRYEGECPVYLVSYQSKQKMYDIITVTPAKTLTNALWAISATLYAAGMIVYQQEVESSVQAPGNSFLPCFRLRRSKIASTSSPCCTAFSHSLRR